MAKMLFYAMLSATVCFASGQLYPSLFNNGDRMCRFDPMQCRPGSWYSLQKMGGGHRDITWNTQAGNGKVFGTLGSTDQGLFGQAGYKQTIFNDARGKLEGQAHGTRVLGPAGDSSQFGGKLDWSNKDASASVDVNKPIGGPTSISATGAGKWHPAKNTEVSASGTVLHEGHGRPDVAVEAKIEHKF